MCGCFDYRYYIFVVNLVVDLIVAALDPRMRKGGSK